MNGAHREFWLSHAHVNPAERRISVGEQTAKLEPKAIAVLTLLAEHPGEVVSRSALFAAVWPGAEVSDEVLSRCVYQLRRALADDSAAPAYIETIPKEGYRLLIHPSPSPPTAAKTDSSHWLRRGAWALILLGITAGASAFFLHQPEHLPPPSVAITPITISPEAPSLAVVGLALNDRLRSAVAEHLGRDDVALEWRSAGSTAEPGNEIDPQYLVHGRLVDNPGEANVLLHMFIDSQSGNETVTSPLNVFEIPRMSSDTPVPRLEAYREAIIERIFYYLTIELPYVHREFSPIEVEAFRLIMFADWELYSGKDCGIGARSLLERSVELNPEAPRAWAQLAEAHWAQIWGCGRDGSYIANARVALSRALEIDPEHIAAHYLQAIIDAETGDAEAAWLALQPLLQAYPDDVYVNYAALQTLVYAGFLTHSTEITERLLAEDPLALSLEMVDLPMSLMHSGDYARFLALAPTKPIDFMRYHRALAFAMSGEKVRARELLDRLRSDDNRSTYTDYAAALEAWLNDDPASVVAVLETIWARRDHHPPLDGSAAFREAQLLALAGSEELAEAAVGQAVDGGFFCVACFRQGAGFDRLAGRPDFEAALSRAESRHRAFANRFNLAAEVPAAPATNQR
ncbi:MAG: winged helix-turn-helix domain-containing protein [Pseudomonadota bacterium]